MVEMEMHLRVKEWREVNDLTRTQVAAEAGVSERTVWRWEDGDGPGPSLVQVAQLEARWPGLVERLGLTAPKQGAA